MVLHTHADRAQIVVAEGIYFTNDPEDITWLMTHNRDPMKCFVGYAGWAPEQLEAETATASWLFALATAVEVFDGSQRQWMDLITAVSPTQAAFLRRPDLVPEDPSVN